jgi:hypothetical protein
VGFEGFEAFEGYAIFGGFKREAKLERLRYLRITSCRILCILKMPHTATSWQVTHLQMALLYLVISIVSYLYLLIFQNKSHINKV